MVPAPINLVESADSLANPAELVRQMDLTDVAIRPIQTVKNVNSIPHLAVSLGSSGAIQVLLLVGMAYIGGLDLGWSPRLIVPPPGANAVASAASAPVIEAALPEENDPPELVAVKVGASAELDPNERAKLAPIVVPNTPAGDRTTAASGRAAIEPPDHLRFAVAAELEIRRQPLTDTPPPPEPPSIVDRVRSAAAPTTRLATVPLPAARSSPASQDLRGVENSAVPQKVFSPEPDYPAELLAARVHGLVLLRVRVAANGRVESAALLRSSGHAAFDDAALVAVRRWRFEPARRAGTAVAIEIKVPIRFVIQDSPR